MQDSNYTITKEIYNEIGGDPVEHFDSTYSIALAILKKMKGGKPSLQALTAIENGVYTPEGFDGYSEVTVAVPEKTFTTEEKTVEITKNGATIILKSENIDGMTKVTANVNVQPNLQEATLAVWENHKKYEIVPDASHDGISKAFVDVNVPEPVLEENKTLDITNNGSYTMTPSQDFDAIKMGTIHVNVPQSGRPEYDWSGTGYTDPAVTNQFDQDWFDQQQVHINKTKQAFERWDPSRTDAENFYDQNHLLYLPVVDTKNVTNMNRCFSWNDAASIPQYDFSSVITANKCFYQCRKLKTIPFLNTSNCIDMEGFFQNCESLETIPAIDFSKNTNAHYLFFKCYALKSLPKLDFSSCTNVNSVFGTSSDDEYYLTDLGGFTGLKIDWNGGGGLGICPNLTKQSVLNVINELYDFRANGDADTTKTIKFSPESLALLTPEELAIGTAKGWNIVS